MDLICQEIGINIQHVCESSVPGRYQLICDKKWLQTLELQRKISKFPTLSKLDNRAHPIGALKHPWVRILVQTYCKKPQTKVFPLPNPAQDTVDFSVAANGCSLGTPLTYSQAITNLTSTNFKNLWETAYKQYHAAHLLNGKQQETIYRLRAKSPSCSLLPHDEVLKEIIQRIFHCPVIHYKIDRVLDGIDPRTKSEDCHAADCHANILPALVAIETSSHISVFFYPPAIVTSLYDCITYSPSMLGKSYNKSFFIVYQILQVARALQAEGLFLGDVRLHDILLRDNLWLQIIPRLETNILPANSDDVQSITSPSDPPMADNGEMLVSSMNVGVGGGAGHSHGDDTGEEDDFLNTADHSIGTKFNLKFAYDLNQFTLREYSEMWCNGQLSNYDYLTILNNASGRSLKNPAYHHIMPWVTDFAARNGANWRDLHKSKYRLNKGDTHLDMMFTHALQQNVASAHTAGRSSQEIPHHVSDFLSEITYFVYMARRTSRHILCEHVRPIWVPAEYPVSIQRLQEWTPDECIPEFYSDPMIFKSIHEDLPDLELPSWATCPEDFIAKHREALESQHVSERLHHWIDLNFGYKLSGKAAIKSKNVCLSVVDQHQNLCQRGVVQLFTHPHPPKRFPSAWFSKTAPRLSQLATNSTITRSLNKANMEKLSPSNPRRLAKSTENLSNDIDVEPRPFAGGLRTSPRQSLRPQGGGDEGTSGSSANFYKSTNFIEMPKDYNPIVLLQGLETMHQFFARTFPNQRKSADPLEKMISSDLLFNEHGEDHSFTNQLFDEPTMRTEKAKSKSLLAPCPSLMRKQTLKHGLGEKQERELQTIGCLIVELFALDRIRPLTMGGINSSYEQRLEACQIIAQLHRNEIPKCVQKVVRILLNLEKSEVVSNDGLPRLTASQLLEPIFASVLIPFPTAYFAIYALIRSLHTFDRTSVLLDIQTHFNCNGHDCARYAEMDHKRVLFERKIAECKVMSCCAHISRLLEPVAYEQFSSIELLLPHIIDLLTDEQTSILTAWNLFDPVAQCLGIAQTQKHLLQPIMKLYDIESFERGMISVRPRSVDAQHAAEQLRFATSSSFKCRKAVKLYHHSFLLRLIVRFGLRCFLHNFIAPLIEAVGGCRDPDECNGFHLHGSGDDSRRTSRSLNYIGADEDNSLTLISQDLADNEVADSNPGSGRLKQEIEDVFTFDDDATSDHISNPGTAENKSIDSFDMRPIPAEEAHEDSAPQKLSISEIFYGSKMSNTSLDDADKTSLNSQPPVDSIESDTYGPKSPTIQIPETTYTRAFQLNTIDCDIGSRKSADSFEIISNAKTSDEAQKMRNIDSQPRLRSVSQDTTDDSLQASELSKISQSKTVQNNRISEMSAESLVWLSHRLGPVLTSRHITRNLLKMLSLCYVGQENLLPESGENGDLGNLNYFTVADARVVGDQSAARVLECLTSIAALFGEELILLQYFPHMSEWVALGSKRITSSLEGALISTLQLLKFIVPCLLDVTIMEHLKDIILDAIIIPIVKLLSSTKIVMPSGYLGRSVLTRKLLDAIYVLCVRIGPDMSKDNLCMPALRPFFLIFNKANVDELGDNEELERGKEELRDVFNPALAHMAYLSFLRYLGEAIIQRTIQNIDIILALCHEFEEPDYKRFETGTGRMGSDAVDCPSSGNNQQCTPAQDDCAANSFGSQVVGNRIEVANVNSSKKEIGPMEVLDMVAYKFDQISSRRHLKGNWLAYWRHEISRTEKESSLSLKQIKLQSFVGHTNSVRAIVALDNENSFLSSSKDKTVKLWSLRSEGDGTKSSTCQFTYTAHKKCIHSLGFLESMRYVVSCDSGVHIWDPFIGRPLGVLDSHKHNPVTIVKCMQSPSPLIVAGTAESSVRFIDARCMQYVNEWRVTVPTQSNATVRCMTLAPSGQWLAVGLSSGSIVTLDTRTGLMLNSWRPMECDLLQLAAPNNQQLISSALDHSLAVWHANDGILHYQLKPPPEPAHFLQTIDAELVFATTGNRIGIYSDLTSSHATYSVTKLRPETFRDVLTSLAVLPLNRAFLAGNESGNIALLC